MFLFGAAAATLSITTYGTWCSRQAVTITQAMYDNSRRITMATLHTKWIGRSGLDREVITTKSIDENDEQHATRHEKAVQALLAIDPKV